LLAAGAAEATSCQQSVSAGGLNQPAVHVQSSRGTTAHTVTTSTRRSGTKACMQGGAPVHQACGDCRRDKPHCLLVASVDRTASASWQRLACGDLAADHTCTCSLTCTDKAHKNVARHTASRANTGGTAACQAACRSRRVGVGRGRQPHNCDQCQKLELELRYQCACEDVDLECMWHACVVGPRVCARVRCTANAIQVLAHPLPLALSPFHALTSSCALTVATSHYHHTHS